MENKELFDYETIFIDVKFINEYKQISYNYDSIKEDIDIEIINVEEI